jgi:hypothetical protein
MRNSRFWSALQTRISRYAALFGLPVTPIAKCGGCDDVVFSIEVDPIWWAVVHLTWSGKPERLPWPRTTEVSLPLTRSLPGH